LRVWKGREKCRHSPGRRLGQEGIVIRVSVHSFLEGVGKGGINPFHSAFGRGQKVKKGGGKEETVGLVQGSEFLAQGGRPSEGNQSPGPRWGLLRRERYPGFDTGTWPRHLHCKKGKGKISRIYLGTGRNRSLDGGGGLRISEGVTHK